MNKKEITKRIYLIGTKPLGYKVKASGLDGCDDIPAPTVRIGNAIVRALRDEAAKRPELFPPSQRPSNAKP